jgi:glycosyltransferase involved in cell wall biosynthesis
MKLISVIMPCYNSEMYIGEAIQSVLNQTYPHFELIILDDGSTDSTKSIIRSFSDWRIKLEVEVENRGIVFQLNKGLSIAKGQFIARMDADDISLPTRFEKQIEFFEDKTNNNIHVLGTDAVSIGRSNKPIVYKNYDPKQISFLLNFYCPILHPTVLMKKTVFDKGLRYSERFKYAEDFALWRMIDNGNNIAILAEQLLHYRIHDGQTNQDQNRLKIQRDSCLKVGEIDSIRLFDNLFFDDIARKYFVDSWFGVRNKLSLNFVQRKYIQVMKKYLAIKSDLLNSFIFK